MRKIDGIPDLAGVHSATRVLEIGSGRGSLAIRAAQRGANVTTVTISPSQATLTRERCARAGLDVDLQLVDYRDVRGEFDAIVSVEMIEAVGGESWSTYLEVIDNALAGHTQLAVTGRHALGRDYAATLRLWRAQFNARWPEIETADLDGTFRRMWEFYLASSEAGFNTGYLDVYQLQMVRPTDERTV